MKNFFSNLFNKLLNLYYLARPNKFNPIFYFILYNEAKSKIFIKNIFELNRYTPEVTKSSSATNVNWILHEELYKTVRKIKPKFVLELGSGVSSTTIAYALKINKTKENIDGKLIYYY